MKFNSLLLFNLLIAALFPFVATAQTLEITNGIQTYSALSNTVVTMTGQCELHITGTNNPISGSTINLNSSDAWLFLPNIRPSVVAASYLSKILVNGSAAVAGSNCRVDEYAMGTVIVPQSPSYTPLQVFSGPNFAGASAQFSLYTYYNTSAALGAMYQNIGSFKLKRGYMATFAQNANGTGASQVFIAQDADLEVGVLATNMEHQCSFVRVFPWRWTGKKGWVGGVSTDTTLVDPLWNYDYDNVTTSTLDIEYVPMRDTASWDAYGNINSKQKSTHVVGFNEPDQANQANMTVAAALAQWPNMVQSGLRVGAPAVSSSGVSGQGLDWLYSFMSQATNLGYRVDYIPVHLYKCSWTTAQFSNYLAGVYQRTGKPVWVTEFNDTDFSSGCNQSQSSESSAINGYISMMEACPFVERYSVYEYFDPSTSLNLITTNNPPALTPVGQIYHNLQSTLAYRQTLPPGGNRGIAQFEFETNTLDSSGYGNNGFAVGIPSYTTGHSGQAVVLDGTNSFIQLPPNIANSNNFTFAAWVNWSGGANGQHIFDFGGDTTHYLYLTPSSSSGTMRFAIRNGGSEQIVETAALPGGQWQHVAVTISGGGVSIYTNGVLAASGSVTIVPSNFNPSWNYLGKSQSAADPLFNGALDEVQIADYVFTGTQVASLLADNPPQFTTNLINGGTATQGVAYSGSVAGLASDPDSGDTLTYSKVTGPAWLSVSSTGALTGTPAFTDEGTNNFTVRVTDATGESAFAVVTVTLPVVIGSGTWTADADGNWSDTSKWSGAFPANGAGSTADFSTITVTADRTVTLDSTRTIGALKFGDTSGAQTWTLGGSDLTLDTGINVSPSIAVNQNTATINLSLDGTFGFTKSGAGTLVLNANNSISGTLNVDTAQPSTGNDGAVQVTFPGAIDNFSAIAILDQNSATSSLQLDGSNGGIASSAPLTLNGRNNGVAAIENLAGSNTLSGGITINTGGGSYLLQSDAGVLDLGGAITSTATGARQFTFQGDGDFNITGAIQNGSATVSLAKSGSGKLTLSGANNYSGPTTISGGTLFVDSMVSTGAVTVASGSTLGGNGVINGAVAMPAESTLAPGDNFGKLTVNNNVTLNAGSQTIMAISPAGASPQTNSQLSVSGLLSFGGTLVVTNQGGALSLGNSFDLFNATGIAGAFATTNLPALDSGLVWDFNPVTGVLTVASTGNTPPTISAIADEMAAENTPGGAIAFTVGDAETPAGSLSVSGLSSNPALIPAGNIVFGGSGANRTVMITPAANQTGAARITLAVSDGSLSTTTSFLITIITTRIGKADNTINLNSPGSWVSGAVPNASAIAVWDSTVTAANSVALGADLSWNGLSISNPAGPVTITSGNTLTLGAGGIDMSGATANLTISSGLTLDTGNQAWNVTNGQTLTLNGAFTRSAGATLVVSGGAGTVAFSRSLVNGLVGPWASVNTSGTAANNSVNGYTYATISGGNVVPYTAATAMTTFGWTSSNPNTQNYDISAVGAVIGVSRTCNTIRYTGAAGIQTYGNGGTITLTANGLLNTGTGALTLAKGVSTGQLAIGANNELVLDAANAGITISVPIIGAGGAVTVVGAGGVTFSSANTYGGNTTVNGALKLGVANAMPAASALVVNGALDMASFSDTVSTLSGNGTIDNSMAGTPVLTVNGANSTTFNGTLMNTIGTLALTKAGSGTLTLAGANTYSGSTVINAGTLLVNGSTSTGPVTAVNSSTLGGGGSIRGPVTIQSGATLAPGSLNAIGTLDMASTVTLQPGSFTRMKTSKSPVTNDVLEATGPQLTYGGTLVVTNLAGALAPGDSFKLFSAPSYAGVFSSISPATPGVGLAWNTTNLTVNGTLSVIATVSPQFNSVAQQGDGNFQFSGAGAAGATYELDAATNLSPPIVWVFVTNAVADQSGLFQFADLQATNFPQRFYRITVGQ
jgi:autotransporter-associated beta strand protein